MPLVKFVAVEPVCLAGTKLDDAVGPTVVLRGNYVETTDPSCGVSWKGRIGWVS